MGDNFVKKSKYRSAAAARHYLVGFGRDSIIQQLGQFWDFTDRFPVVHTITPDHCIRINLYGDRTCAEEVEWGGKRAVGKVRLRGDEGGNLCRLYLL